MYRLEMAVNPVVVVLSTFMSAFFIHYFVQVVKMPEVYTGNRHFKKLLMLSCKSLNKKYKPPFFAWGGKLQTLLRGIFCSVKGVEEYNRDILILSDGGEVGLDWDLPHTLESNSTPVVVLLPGLTGSSQACYVRRLVHEVTSRGYRCVVFNNRGNGGVPLKTPHTYCAAYTSDLSQVIEYVRKCYPTAPILSAGVSLGGIILSNYLAENGDDTGLCAAFTVSMAWNLQASSQSLEEPLNKWLFNRYLCNLLLQKIIEYQEVFEKDYDFEKIKKSTCIREFDDHFVAPQFGFSGWKEYYKAASVTEKISEIKTPLLALGAADDPFAPLHSLPIDAASSSQHVALCVTYHGGHIGFMQGLWPTGATLMEEMFGDFLDLVFKNPNDFPVITKKGQ